MKGLNVCVGGVGGGIGSGQRFIEKSTRVGRKSRALMEIRLEDELTCFHLNWPSVTDCRIMLWIVLNTLMESK